jgi:hypothetical protein
MTFDPQITTITQNEIVPKIVDQTLQSNPMTLIFLANARPWNGVTLDFPVKLTNHTQGGGFNDYTEFKAANENVRQLASFDVRGYYQSVVIGGIARSVNAVSKTQLLNLVKVEMESVGQDMVDGVGTTFHNSGTDATLFQGLDAGMDDTSSYGGLSPATYANWKATIQTTVGAFDFSKARTLMNSATVGSQKPNILDCNETVYGYVEADYTATVQGNYQVMDGARARLTSKGIIPGMRAGLTGNAGFDVLFYDGVPIVKNDKEDSGKLRANNTDFYRFYGLKAVEAQEVDLSATYHEGNDYDGGVPSTKGFNWTGFVRPAKQYAWIGQFLLLGNLVTPARRLHSYSDGINS